MKRILLFSLLTASLLYLVSGGLQVMSAPPAPAEQAANPGRFKEGTDNKDAIHALERKLQGKRWSYPRDDIPEATGFVEFKAKNVLQQGWSLSKLPSTVTWRVVGERMVELQSMYTKPFLDVIEFDATFKTGTIDFPDRGKFPIKLLRN